jgi:hypothetical protein
MSIPGVTTKLRYKIPFYDYQSWFCYSNPIKGEGVELVFLQGQSMTNEHGLLLAKGRKMVSGISLYKDSIISDELLQEMIFEAIEKTKK